MRWLPLGVLGTAALVAPYVFLRDGPLGYSAAYGSLGLVAIIAVIWGARASPSSERRLWYLVALALGCLSTGDALVVLDALRPTWIAYPFVADVASLGGYVVLVVGLLMLARDRGVEGRAPVIDAAIVATAAASIAWALIVQPALADPSLTALEKLVSTSYPLAGIGVIMVVLCLRVPGLTGSRIRTPAAIAAMLLLVGDGLYVLGRLHGWGDRATPAAALSAAAALLWATLALRSASWDGTPAIAEVKLRPTRGRLKIIAIAVAAGLAMTALEGVRHGDGAVGVALAMAVVLAVLVSFRLADVVVGFERSEQREGVLQAGAAALVAAQTRDDIRRVVAETSLTLAGGERNAHVVVELTPRPELSVRDAVVVGTGEVADALRGELRCQGALGQLGIAKTLVIPIVVRRRLEGILRVSTRHALPADLRSGLEMLGAQAALALESALATADLLERRSEARFRSLVQTSKDLIAVLERDLTIRYVTPSVHAMLGYEPADLLGTQLERLLDPDDRDETSRLVREEAAGARSLEHEFRLLHRDGTSRVVEGVISDLREDPSVRGFVLTAHDVTQQRALADQLTYQAFHDSLTGLPNRALLTDRIGHALDRARRLGSDVAVLFLDVDDFKTINDSLGHAAGDELLVELGTRLRDCTRAMDTAARLGGDEFALLLEETAGVEGAMTSAERILNAVARPIDLGSTQVLAGASIGIALAQPEQTAGDLLRNADVAMYRAKHQGGRRVELFQPHMHQAAITRLELKADLERAFHSNELDLHYQPIVSLKTGRIIGLEALLRWTHPVRGPIPPSEFVALAEATGLINDVGRWVLRRACQQTRRWQMSVPGCERLSASVNLSGRQILQPTFKEDIAEAVAGGGLHPKDIVLEITESTLMEDVEGVATRLAELRALGIRIAIDDFGTGFSSLSYLQRFPVDSLKVAREFVHDVVHDTRKARLVEAIVSLARSLDLETIAEGIEEPAQRQRLEELGCTFGQGFLFAKPTPAVDVPALLLDPVGEAA
jgi:diguanylate cyclase (GGDEF)-like protein/PAS domain S-box-containing protein